MKTSPTTNSIFPALYRVQELMPTVTKDGRNPHFGSRYVTLANLLQLAGPVLRGEGLITVMDVEADPDAGDRASLTAIHAESGEWVQLTVPFVVEKKTGQGVGSALTYCWRYLTGQLLAVAGVDDDGEAAERRPRKAAPSPEKRQGQSDEAMAKLRDYAAKRDVDPQTVMEIARAMGSTPREMTDEQLRRLCGAIDREAEDQELQGAVA